ncbi:MAG: hypothetical protein ACRETT_09925, partial [Steroidobacteraceae bacterium]
APGLKAIFEPRIEQYSFATARETGGRHYAVTIRYRINLYAPEGTLADTYTLTGYGSSLAKGMSSGGPLKRASLAAMRDAAAKFLVQFPDLPAGKRLAQNEPIVVEKSAENAASGAEAIEAVPIYESKDASASPPAPSAPPPTPEEQPPPKLTASRSRLPTSGFRSEGHRRAQVCALLWPVGGSRTSVAARVSARPRLSGAAASPSAIAPSS